LRLGEEESMSVSAATKPSGPAAVGATSAPIHSQIALPAEDILYEVVDGEIKEKTVDVQVSATASLLIGFLGMFVRSHRLGRVIAEVLFRIDQRKDLQRRPDVAFVSHSKWPANRRVPDGSVWDLVPDLAVEVVSSTNSASEVQRKIHEYLEAGVIRLWIIYPEQETIHIYSSPKQIQVLQLGDELDGGDLIPGFRLPLAALFEDDPE
jgi:Uma2 family endonuclease